MRMQNYNLLSSVVLKLTEKNPSIHMESSVLLKTGSLALGHLKGKHVILLGSEIKI